MSRAVRKKTSTQVGVCPFKSSGIALQKGGIADFEVTRITKLLKIEGLQSA